MLPPTQAVDRGFNFKRPTQCAVLLLSFKHIFLEETQDGFFCSIRIIGFTHSSLFQYIWNVHSFQFWFNICIFLFISSFFSCAFLLIFCLFRDGSFSLNALMYHSPLITCYNVLLLYFKISGLGVLTDILWNRHTIFWVAQRGLVVRAKFRYFIHARGHRFRTAISKVWETFGRVDYNS